MSYTHENLTLHGNHEPEYSTELGPDGNKIQVELPGHYTIGADVDGAFVPLMRFPAGRLLKDIARAQKRKQDEGEQSGEQQQQSESEQYQQPQG